MNDTITMRDRNKLNSTTNHIVCRSEKESIRAMSNEEMEAYRQSLERKWRVAIDGTPKKMKLWNLMAFISYERMERAHGR